MTEIKYNNLKILLAILFITYLIYIRILLIRLPKTLNILENNIIKWNLVTIIFIGILFSSYMLKKNIYRINDKNTNIFNHFLTKIILFLTTSLKELHTLILKYIPNNYEIMSYLALKFYTKFSTFSETIFLFILFTIRFIILITFLVDVFVYFELNYMYKALYLLCISLLIDLSFYLLNDFSQNYDEIKSMLIIQEVGIDPQTQLPLTDYYLKEEYKHLNLKYLVQEYILCSKLVGYLNIYEKYKSYFLPKFNIIIYSLYLIGWLFIICKNVSSVLSL